MALANHNNLVRLYPSPKKSGSECEWWLYSDGKQIIKTYVSEESRQLEIEVLQSVRHPCVLPFIAHDDVVINGQKKPALLFRDFSDTETLTDFVRNCIEQIKNPEQLKSLTGQIAEYVLKIAEVLHYLHQNHILYLCVYPENIRVKQQQLWLINFLSSVNLQQPFGQRVCRDTQVFLHPRIYTTDKLGNRYFDYKTLCELGG